MAVSGPAVLCGGATGVYDAGPDCEGYQWTVDTVPVARTRKLTLTGLAPGLHTVSVTVRRSGCTVSDSLAVNGGPTPAVTFKVCHAGPAVL